jgi:putative SOS response-associated peptidase YedK
MYFAQEFGVTRFVNVDFAPRYNIAPSQYVEAIIQNGTEQRLGSMKWGVHFTIGQSLETCAHQRASRDSSHVAIVPRGVPATALLDRGGWLL